MEIIRVTDAEMEQVKALLDNSTAGPKGPEVTQAAIGAYYRAQAARLGTETPAQRYARWYKTTKELAQSDDPRIRAEWDRANDGLRVKDLAPGAVHQNATLTNLSVQYANEEYIGDQLLPILPVTKESGTIYLYGQSDRLELPDDEMGARGEANEIQESRSSTTYQCQPYGLSNFVATRTLQNQDAPLDEMIDITAAINEILALKREIRQATLLVTNTNFPSQTAAIAAGDRWDTSTGGNPIKNIQDAVAAVWNGYGPGRKVAYSSLAVYNVLSRHPALLGLFQYNGSSPGLASPGMIAGFLGIDGYLVGKAWKDTSKEGAAAVISRVWSDVFGIVRVAASASTRNAAFGYTIQQGQPITNVEYRPMDGHGGGHKAQVSRSYQVKVLAAPAGYLYTTPIG